ncbi:MAG: hemerythrin domain-containing protein [Deltaproteobacteria bacterium]|nr:hemerythrin domain-containing protein [Deltaproteobacteria bacterium]
MTVETNHLRLHHRELTMLSEEIIDSIDPAGLVKDSVGIRRMLSKLAGKLVYHLAYEDMSVYPHLMHHPDPKVKETVKVFVDEAGGLRDAFEKYMRRWVHDLDIRDEPDEFVVETLNILRTVNKRIEMEDTILYVLVDKYGASS